MLKLLLQWSMRNRLVVVFAAAALLAVGGYAAATMAVDVFPDLTAPTVTVLTESCGSSSNGGRRSSGRGR